MHENKRHVLDLQKRDLLRDVQKSNHIVVLTGAGISTLSGIPDFRSKDSAKHFPSEYSFEEVLSKDFDINLLRSIYSEYFIPQFLKANPNKVHDFISNLQEHANVEVFTQNIDGLHERSGSKNVFNVHGEGMKMICSECTNKLNTYDHLGDNYIFNGYCSVCKTSNYLRPDIVLYGEQVRFINKAIDSIMKSDLLIVLGTSLTVFPFNNLVQYGTSTKKYFINNHRTNYDRHFDELIITDFKDFF